ARRLAGRLQAARSPRLLVPQRRADVARHAREARRGPEGEREVAAGLVALAAEQVARRELLGLEPRGIERREDPLDPGERHGGGQVALREPRARGARGVSDQGTLLGRALAPAIGELGREARRSEERRVGKGGGSRAAGGS